ncbi:hypothetical protein RRG08_061036 [Elysia crispata]|uniref:Uncharacterized protein n=1 Tax=Elysia crispata TaxID=231223 RepID=A0AAE1E4S2_9GAST|nr:hypothetical protein RRG08_061036 [Elysia crispata]
MRRFCATSGIPSEQPPSGIRSYLTTRPTAVVPSVWLDLPVRATYRTETAVTYGYRLNFRKIPLIDHTEMSVGTRMSRLSERLVIGIRLSRCFTSYVTEMETNLSNQTESRPNAVQGSPVTGKMSGDCVVKRNHLLWFFLRSPASIGLRSIHLESWQDRNYPVNLTCPIQVDSPRELAGS